MFFKICQTWIGQASDQRGGSCKVPKLKTVQFSLALKNLMISCLIMINMTPTASAADQTAKIEEFLNLTASNFITTKLPNITTVIFSFKKSSGISTILTGQAIPTLPILSRSDNQTYLQLPALDGKLSAPQALAAKFISQGFVKSIRFYKVVVVMEEAFIMKDKKNFALFLRQLSKHLRISVNETLSIDNMILVVSMESSKNLTVIQNKLKEIQVELSDGLLSDEEAAVFNGFLNYFLGRKTCLMKNNLKDEKRVKADKANFLKLLESTNATNDKLPLHFPLDKGHEKDLKNYIDSTAKLSLETVKKTFDFNLKQLKSVAEAKDIHSLKDFCLVTKEEFSNLKTDLLNKVLPYESIMSLNTFSKTLNLSLNEKLMKNFTNSENTRMLLQSISGRQSTTLNISERFKSKLRETENFVDYYSDFYAFLSQLQRFLGSPQVQLHKDRYLGDFDSWGKNTSSGTFKTLDAGQFVKLMDALVRLGEDEFKIYSRLTKDFKTFAKDSKLVEHFELVLSAVREADVVTCHGDWVITRGIYLAVDGSTWLSRKNGCKGNKMVYFATESIILKGKFSYDSTYELVLVAPNVGGIGDVIVESRGTSGVDITGKAPNVYEDGDQLRHFCENFNNDCDGKVGGNGRAGGNFVLISQNIAGIQLNVASFGGRGGNGQMAGNRAKNVKNCKKKLNTKECIGGAGGHGGFPGTAVVLSKTENIVVFQSHGAQGNAGSNGAALALYEKFSICRNRTQYQEYCSSGGLSLHDLKTWKVNESFVAAIDLILNKTLILSYFKEIIGKFCSISLDCKYVLIPPMSCCPKGSPVAVLSPSSKEALTNFDPTPYITSYINYSLSTVSSFTERSTNRFINYFLTENTIQLLFGPHELTQELLALTTYNGTQTRQLEIYQSQLFSFISRNYTYAKPTVACNTDYDATKIVDVQCSSCSGNKCKTVYPVAGYDTYLDCQKAAMTLLTLSESQKNFATSKLENALVLDITFFLKQTSEEIGSFEEQAKNRKISELMKKTNVEFQNSTDNKVKDVDKLITENSKRFEKAFNTFHEDAVKSLNKINSEISENGEQILDLRDEQKKLEHALIKRESTGLFDVFHNIFSLGGKIFPAIHNGVKTIIEKGVAIIKDPIGAIPALLGDVGNAISSGFNTIVGWFGRRKRSVDDRIEIIDAKMVEIEAILNSTDSKGRFLGVLAKWAGRVLFKSKAWKSFKVGKFKNSGKLEKVFKDILPDLDLNNILKEFTGKDLDENAKNLIGQVSHLGNQIFGHLRDFDFLKLFGGNGDSDSKEVRDRIQQVTDRIKSINSRIHFLEELREGIYDLVFPTLESIHEALENFVNFNKTLSQSVFDSSMIFESLRRKFRSLKQFAQQKLPELTPAILHMIDDVEHIGITSQHLCERRIHLFERQEMANYVYELESAKYADYKFTDKALGSQIAKIEEKIKLNSLIIHYDQAFRAYMNFVFPFGSNYAKFFLHNNIGNLTSVAKSHIDSILTSLTEEKKILREGDKTRFIGTGKFYPSRASHPFYVWNSDRIKHLIPDLFRGETIRLHANVIDSPIDFDCIKFNFIEIQLVARDPAINEKLKNASESYIYILRHSGNSHFRVSDNFYGFHGPALEFERSFEKDSFSGGDNVKIEKGDLVLSPYTTWEIRLRSVVSTNAFKALETFVSEEIDILLVGKGTFLPVDPKREKIEVDEYYRKETVHTDGGLDVDGGVEESIDDGRSFQVKQSGRGFLVRKVWE